MKAIYLSTATLPEMEAWVRSQLGEDPHALFEDDYRRDQSMYAAELENLISEALADNADKGLDLD